MKEDSIFEHKRNWRRTALSPPPLTYFVPSDFAEHELDYADMIALSGMFRRWAIYEENVEPEARTKLIQLSADYELLAKWVGETWRAEAPSAQMPLIKFLAVKERRWDNVIRLELVRQLLFDDKG